MTFTNLSRLEFSEFVEQNVAEEIKVVTYRYHWSDENDSLICRWDNTPHFPKLENSPDHIHIGDDQVISGKPINIFGVLDEIKKRLNK